MTSEPRLMVQNASINDSEDVTDYDESSQLLTPSSSYHQQQRSNRRPVHYASINPSVPPGLQHSISQNDAVLSRYKYYSRLAPHSDSIMMMPNHIVPLEFWSALPVTPIGKQSSLITIIWNTMMGTSLLSMPWALDQAGFALGLALMVFMAFITLYTAYRVMTSINTIAGCSEVLEFSDVCKHYLGRPGEICAVIFSVITLLGGAIVYWVLMSNFLYNIVFFIDNQVTQSSHHHGDNVNISHHHDDYIHCDLKNNGNVSHNSQSPTLFLTTSIFQELWDSQKTAPFFLIVLLFPLVNFKSPTFFTKFNALGTISVLYLIGFITYKAIRWGFHMDFNVVPGSYASWSFPALTGVMSLAFFIHSCVLSIVRNQAKPENNARDLTIAFICVTFTYIYVAAVFYAAWPLRSKSCIDQNLLNNLLAADPLAFIARIFLFLQMMTVFPLLLYIMRIQVMHVMFDSVWPSWKHVFVLNIAIVGVCLIFARFLPHIGSIIRYTGAFSGLVYMFVLPSLTYLLSLKHQAKLSSLTVVLHLLLILLGVANLVSQFLIS